MFIQSQLDTKKRFQLLLSTNTFTLFKKNLKKMFSEYFFFFLESFNFFFVTRLSALLVG
jgi:hypothetical protein